MKRQILSALLLGAGLTLALSPSPLRAAPAAPPAHRPGPPDPRMGLGGPRGRMGERMAQELNLTPQQQAKIKALNDRFRKQMDAMRGSTGPMDQKRGQFEAMRDKRRQEMMAILTPAQRTKMQALRAQRGPGGMGPGGMGIGPGGRGPGGMGMGPGGGPGGRRPGGMGPRGLMEFQQMADKLNLNPTQKKQVAGILKASQTRAQSLIKQANNPKANPDALRQQMRDLRRTTIEQIHSKLTPQQWAKAQAEMRQQREARRNDFR